MRLRCTNCRSFFPKESHSWHFKNKIQRICSESCYNEWSEARRLKSRNNRKKTYSAKKQSRMIPPDIRHAITDRDKCCRVCSAAGSEVHHITFRSQGGKNEMSNLIFLCSECHHTLAHGPEAPRYAQLFRGYVWMRYLHGRRVPWGQVLSQCEDLVDWEPRVAVAAS